jgi:hypothetical protein
VARPSIFSKEYERHRKRRKKVIAIIIILIIASVGVFFSSGSLKQIFISKVSSYKNLKLFSVLKGEKKEEIPSNNANVKENDVENNSQENQNTAAETQNQVEERGYEVELSNGTKIKAVYETKEGLNRFKYILPLDAPVTFSMNTSGTAMVLLDNESQNMILVDIGGKVQNITNLKYTYSKDGKNIVYNKETVLSKYKKNNYIWCSSPKFIDDENIVYLSQLPHISSKVSTKYLWSVNIKNMNSHKYEYSLKGESLKLGNNTDKGVELLLDNGTINYVKVIDGELKVSK